MFPLQCPEFEQNIDNLHCNDEAYLSLDGKTAYSSSTEDHIYQLFHPNHLVKIFYLHIKIALFNIIMMSFLNCN